MRVNYYFKGLTPLFTGSDEKNGTVRTLRREKVRLKESISFNSTFQSEEERTSALMDIIHSVYSEIDVKLKSENYGFYDAYANKVKAATYVQTKKQFLTKLLTSCNVISMSESNSKTVRTALDKFSSIELLETIKNEHSYLMILLREYTAFFKSDKKTGVVADKSLLHKQLYSNNTPVEQITKNFDKVPYFGGNSIRGYLRRIVMYDFCKLAGVTNLNKTTYHRLFTGGNITDSTGFEDIQKREDFIKNCPPIGLFGSAIGNMTIEGEMLVQGARLQCKENGTSDVSFWEQIELNFGTRLDSSKRETDIHIGENEKEAPTSQMIYQYENFVTGSVFDSSFILKTEDKLLVSVFWRMINLWKEQPTIGGNSARDSGIIDINIDVPQDADKLYLDYIKDNIDTIKSYFNAG